MLDQDIRREDVQGLSDADQVAAFFSVLGYRTDARLQQTAANLGITAPSLSRQITRIERIAEHEGQLQVYLFELSSVTVTAMRGIASALRNRAGDYLLVLTHDYERIDFVLIEKTAPTPQPGRRIGQRQVSVRARPLTVERRNPSRVALRVLRRLSYTEADPQAQLAKLESAFDVSEWSDEHFNNRALFADYYLRERLPERAEWDEDAKPVYRDLCSLYDRAATRWGDQLEGELRSGLLEPAFRALGFEFQEVKGSDDDRREPDYLLREAGGDETPVAVCLTYRWNRFLDGRDDERDTETPVENPGAAVVSLLERGDAPYAIVTNGKHWRLYAARTHSRATNYYEIDLEETLALDDPADSFRYFWLMFRARSHVARDTVKDGETVRCCFVDELIDGSQQYAKELGDRLKDRVFDEIYPYLAAGFIAHMRTREEKGAQIGQEVLDRVFHGTLTLLYRLLFLLYAESRDLLPVKEMRGYYQRSLTRIKREVAERAGEVSDEVPARLRKAWPANSCELYDRLAELFRTVDEGDADCNVPTYNGGLFLTKPDPNEHGTEAEAARFLLTNKIPDRYLALGLELLARDDDAKTFQRVAIDYKSLGVRQLGSIYEGLLEFRLRIATEKMAICKGKQSELVVPYAEARKKKLAILTVGRGKDAAERVLAKNAVYLENDKRERKATGSYYTPDYIVEYIVENTVGPALDERFAAVRPLLYQAQKTRHAEQRKADALRKRGSVADDPDREAYLKTRGVVDDLFGVRILDAAMGSGHFLVEAVDRITDRMLDFLNGFAWNPVVHHLRETRETIERGLNAQGVTVDRAKLTDVNLLKRHVLKRCIFGVDINPMAVELAKVSLWLDSFTLGAPLSFLDHHLKCGNSLIGATVGEVNDAIQKGQLSLLSGTQFEGMKQAVAGMVHVGELSDVTAAEVKESRDEFKRATAAMAPAKRLLDVYVSQWYGNEPRRVGKGKKSHLHEPALEFLRHRSSSAWARGGDAENLNEEWRMVAAKATEARDRRLFFHWDLEFPEVFYGPRDGTTQVIERKADGGFDAVVGNPPWIRQETIQADKGALASRFAEVFDGVADVYVYFLARGLTLLTPQRSLGMIVPNKWHRAAYGKKLRGYLAESAQPTDLVDFGHAPIFPDADTFPCILIVRRSAPTESPDPLLVCSVPRERLANIDLPSTVRDTSHPVEIARLRASGWGLERGDVAALMEKIRAAGVPLKEYAGCSPLYGIKTGFNEAFLIDQATRDRLVAGDPKCEPLIKKFLRGSDIQRWHSPWGGEWMIFARRGMEMDRYPSITKHLNRFRTQLEPRPRGWDSDKQGKWPGRKPGAYKWYELQDTIDYYEDFERPKIMYQVIAYHSRFVLEKTKLYSNDKTFILPSADLYLLAVLNSSVLWRVMWTDLPHMKDEAIAMQGFAVESLPIPEPDNGQREAVAGMAERLVSLTREQQALHSSFGHIVRDGFGAERITRKLESYWHLDADALVREVRRAGAAKLSAAGQRELVEQHARQIALLAPIFAESRQLEIGLQQQIFDLYGLTPDEVRLLRATAPPRDPLALAEQCDSILDATPPGRHTAGHDTARAEERSRSGGAVAARAPDAGGAAGGLSGGDSGTGGSVDGVRGRAGRSADAEGSPANDPHPDRSTRYIDTLSGPRSFAELAPELGRAVEEVQATLARASSQEYLITRDWLCDLHRRAFARFVDWAGTLRDRDVRVGNHEPPPYFEVPAFLEDYCADVEVRLAACRGGDPDPAVVETLAFAEGRFLFIHPFRDFNGRIARLLLFSLLIRLDLPPVALVPADQGEREPYLAALAAADDNDYAPLQSIWSKRLAAVTS